jgi:hypothetical protein
VLDAHLRAQAAGHSARACAAEAARSLLWAAFEASTSKHAVTPFSLAASEELNLVYSGGKLDDITIMVPFQYPRRRCARGCCARPEAERALPCPIQVAAVEEGDDEWSKARFHGDTVDFA